MKSYSKNFWNLHFGNDGNRGQFLVKQKFVKILYVYKLSLVVLQQEFIVYFLNVFSQFNINILFHCVQILIKYTFIVLAICKTFMLVILLFTFNLLSPLFSVAEEALSD